MRLFKIFLLVFLMLPLVRAETGHISLLTVGGINDSEGDVADLYLEVRPGSGSIFIDSFPLTKLDTQISTRYANEIACDFLNKDCSKYDFFYTIRAKASIVGGPSAGAAISVLTISVLSDTALDPKAIMSGTINSGGLIGPVAGIDAKIEAAVDNGFNKIIIPKWQSAVNITKIEEKGVGEKITIVKVKNLEEALYYFTGHSFSKPDKNLSVSKEYSNKMAEVANILCERSATIDVEANQSNESLYYNAQQFLNRSEQALLKEDFYSRASYCFTANLKLREAEFAEKTSEELQVLFEQTLEEFDRIEEKTDSIELKTLSDLETYMIVKERLSETELYLDEIDYENVSSSLLSYAYERLFSAVAWSEFFGLNGEPLNLDQKYLEEGCLKKVAEAEEMINYADIYLPGFLEETKKEIDNALELHNSGEFPLCIFKASKAKAEANILLTALSIQDEDLDTILNEKLEAIKKVILKQEQNDMFPILGYSYYEYAKSLSGHDPAASLTFSEYALEFSRIDMYFPIKKKWSFDYELADIQMFIYGFIAGAAFIILARLNQGRKK